DAPLAGKWRGQPTLVAQRAAEQRAVRRSKRRIAGRRGGDAEAAQRQAHVGQPESGAPLTHLPQVVAGTLLILLVQSPGPKAIRRPAARRSAVNQSPARIAHPCRSLCREGKGVGLVGSRDRSTWAMNSEECKPREAA